MSVSSRPTASVSRASSLSPTVKAKSTPTTSTPTPTTPPLPKQSKASTGGVRSPSISSASAVSSSKPSGWFRQPPDNSRIVGPQFDSECVALDPVDPDQAAGLTIGYV